MVTRLKLTRQRGHWIEVTWYVNRDKPKFHSSLSFEFIVIFLIVSFSSHPSCSGISFGLRPVGKLTANLLLMSNTERLDGLTKGNFGLTRFTSGGETQLIGTGRSRRRRFHEAENPDKQRYECCQ